MNLRLLRDKKFLFFLLVFFFFIIVFIIISTVGKHSSESQTEADNSSQFSIVSNPQPKEYFLVQINNQLTPSTFEASFGDKTFILELSSNPHIFALLDSQNPASIKEGDFVEIPKIGYIGEKLVVDEVIIMPEIIKDNLN